MNAVQFDLSLYKHNARVTSAAARVKQQRARTCDHCSCKCTIIINTDRFIFALKKNVCSTCKRQVLERLNSKVVYFFCFATCALSLSLVVFNVRAYELKLFTQITEREREGGKLDEWKKNESSGLHACIILNFAIKSCIMHCLCFNLLCVCCCCFFT